MRPFLNEIIPYISIKELTITQKQTSTENVFSFTRLQDNMYNDKASVFN